MITSECAELDCMRQFSPTHVAMLATTAATCTTFVAAARKVRGTSREPQLRRAWGYTHLAAGLCSTAVFLDPKQFDVGESLPLHLCDVLRPIMALGLIKENPHAINITYYWGLLLNPQAIISPNLTYNFQPRWFRFSTYWFFHITALATPLAMTFGLGYRPTWRGYRKAVALSPLWLLAAAGVNRLSGGNYGFLSHPPENPSLMDKFGPWPYYIAVECAIAAGCWAAMTAPWETARGRKKTRLIRGGFLRKALD